MNFRAFSLPLNVVRSVAVLIAAPIGIVNVVSGFETKRKMNFYKEKVEGLPRMNVVHPFPLFFFLYFGPKKYPTQSERKVGLS